MPTMRASHMALLLTVILAVSLSDGTAAEDGIGPNFSPNACTAMISPGPGCDPGKCSTDCTQLYKGGLGDCEPAGCRCTYTCLWPPHPPATSD